MLSNEGTLRNPMAGPYQFKQELNTTAQELTQPMNAFAFLTKIRKKYRTYQTPELL